MNLLKGFYRAILGTGLLAVAVSAAELRVAAFRADATPAMGEPLIWIQPTTKVEDPLLAKGVVLDDGKHRYVLCSVDWCGLGGSTHLLFRRKAAAAAGTDISRVTIHSVHQHTAPYIDGGAYSLMRTFPNPPLLMSDEYLEAVTDRLAGAVKEAVKRLQPFDSIGVGEARVERVASARRIHDDGKLVTRYSTGAKDPKMAALPEGEIDPAVRTVTLANGGKPLVRLHYYATHPQTFCCDGRVSGDFVNTAREKLEQDEGIPQVYFTGCAGNVTVGKYNDGSEKARAELARQLRKGFDSSIDATRFHKAAALRWKTTDLKLPPKPGIPTDPSALKGKSGVDLYRSAQATAFCMRTEPLTMSLLEIGPARIIHMPGEPMLEFQKYALGVNRSPFLAVAGYGDISPGYLCTDQAFREGGYEPSASNAGPGTEAQIKKAIDKLLRK